MSPLLIAASVLLVISVFVLFYLLLILITKKEFTFREYALAILDIAANLLCLFI